MCTLRRDVNLNRTSYTSDKSVLHYEQYLLGAKISPQATGNNGNQFPTDKLVDYNNNSVTHRSPSDRPLYHVEYTRSCPITAVNLARG